MCVCQRKTKDSVCMCVCVCQTEKKSARQMEFERATRDTGDVCCKENSSGRPVSSVNHHHPYTKYKDTLPDVHVCVTHCVLFFFGGGGGKFITMAPTDLVPTQRTASHVIALDGKGEVARLSWQPPRMDRSRKHGKLK